MKFRPPTNRVDSPIVFVHPADDAWDTDAVVKSTEEHGEDSPFSQYHSGATRYDLQAMGAHGAAGDMLGPGATEYHLRRLSMLELNEVQGLMEREFAQQFPIPRSAYLQACRYGLVAIKSDGRDVMELNRRGGSLSVDDVDTLAECTELGPSLIMHLGQAVYLASQPLRDAEKKR
jgi:hypothetical protein